MTVLRRLAGTLTATAAAFALTAAPTPAVADDDDRDAGGTTTVTIPADVAGLLTGLGVSPVGPGTLAPAGSNVAAAFPITEIDDGVIEHSGGLQFAGPQVKITRFEVDPTAGVLTARTKVMGQRLGRVAVFTLGAEKNVAGQACAGVGAGLYLTEAAATALGNAKLAGAFIGDACVVPELDGDDDDDEDDDDDDGDDD